MIIGTPMREGSIKSEVVIKGIKTKCRFEAKKIGNLMREDSFGNPAYYVKYEISLSDGFDGKIDFKKEGDLTNLFKVENGKLETRDFEYSTQDESVKVKMDKDGYVETVNFAYKDQKVACQF